MVDGATHCLRMSCHFVCSVSGVRRGSVVVVVVVVVVVLVLGLAGACATQQTPKSTTIDAVQLQTGLTRKYEKDVSRSMVVGMIVCGWM